MTVEATSAARSPRAGAGVDVVIVGGGPAGLSAALTLGRACRSVLVCDGGPGRNAPAAGVRGFFSQDGTPPDELRRIGREQLAPYDVRIENVSVVDARTTPTGFEVALEGGRIVACRKLILATGLVDDLPDVPGLQEQWGRGVIHCPYCHGWEHRGQPWTMLLTPEHVIEMATLLSGWTKQLTLLTHGATDLPADVREWLTQRHVALIEDRIERVEQRDGHLTGVSFDTGRVLACAALFVRPPFRQRSPLPEKLGCQVVDSGPMAGMVKTEHGGSTTVPGLYVVGDASAGPPHVAFAVAGGSLAAAMANRAMLTEEVA